MMAGWSADRGRALAGACVRRRWWRVAEELLMLCGATRGLAHALAGSNGHEVCDAHRDVAITVATNSMTTGKIV
jgi:hypothetical protein